MLTCSVKGCSNQSRLNKNVSYYKILSQERKDIRDTWIRWGRGGDVRRLRSAALRGKKKKENLRPAAPKVIILRLRHYQDIQVVIYIACKLCTSKLINQKTIILGKGK